ncbi:EamA-like transporter family protein [Aliiroseovarius sediminilitoris]|uniref:EamA-like transporter family protein n=1 Tax=Aliiroseovarius sediminilitoris TaxID=1173584 RepID=A0A1I0NPR6_9RHOB|nr:DMT family transporter [Aliiroseovarius sediminilitoris]SEW03411.1 EamA-like transporter family protein [Aliiroseovarius sediminilitoris]
MAHQLTLTTPVKAAGLMVLAGASFAVVNTALQGATMKMGASAPSVTFWQYLIALGFYLPWVVRHRAAAIKTGQVWLHILRVALAAGGVQLWTLGLAYVPIWQAIALILLSPFFVTLGAGLFLRETVSMHRWGAVLLGIIGGAVILEPWSDRFELVALLPVGAAALWAASSVITKFLTRADGPETVTIYLLVLLSPINAALALGSGFTLPMDAIWLVVGAGLLTAFAQHVLVRAYSLADAAFLQPFDHLKLVFNVVLGFAVFGFLPTGSMWLGTAIILAASFYLLEQERRQTV